jgi:O-glycosyl hydrolase
MKSEFPVRFLLGAVAGACLLAGQTPVELPDVAPPPGGKRFEFDAAGERRAQWSVGGLRRVYFDEDLPALFSRTLVLDGALPAGSAFDWIFTGDHGGVTVHLEGGLVRLIQRYYDSYGHYADLTPKARYPNRVWQQEEIAIRGVPRTVEVVMDHRLAVELRVNGRTLARRRCLMEMRRHQAAWTPPTGATTGTFAGRMIEPAPLAARLRVNPATRHQRIYGFGGILSVPAYARLTPAGKRRWFELLREYNLLIQREYPNGYRLKRDLTNFDRLEDASPHYYGDNFPNGEISDFDYNRRIRALGGKVIFEFWAFPEWARREYVAADGRKYPQAPVIDEYVRAMVGYCKIAREKAGAPPDVVGVQNEVEQPAELWHEMIPKLRQGLDAAGFRGVQIHMPDHGNLRGGTRNALAIRKSPAAWKLIDWAATHVYDYQSFFEDPDGYDATIRAWREAAGDKPFLSTEFTINNNIYQANTYRVAFAQAQLYHKNMALMDAAALMYCWTLLEIEQSSFGGTRSLFVPDRARGYLPVASSYQLRAFGAFSRRLPEGMVRVAAEAEGEGLLATAYQGPAGAKTAILINRATAPLRVAVEWPGAAFTVAETASPYQENAVRRAGQGSVTIRPGEIVTLSNVALRSVPATPRAPAPAR